LKKGINPQIQRAVALPQQSRVLSELNTREQNVKNAKRVMDQAKQESSSVAGDQDSKAEGNDKKTWKIVIGVGLGIGLVTAVGYYALKE